jgi:hypothetical protein
MGKNSQVTHCVHCEKGCWENEILWGSVGWEVVLGKLFCIASCILARMMFPFYEFQCKKTIYPLSPL